MGTGNVPGVWTFLYRSLWVAARAVAPLLGLRNGKAGTAVRGRQRGAGELVQWAARYRDTSKPLVWFHAASVGEGRQAEAVLLRLRSARPGWQLVYTHTSPSAERLAGSLPADFAGYLPADTVRDTGAALDAVQPAALVFSTADLWPELVRQAAARGVALGLVSATLAEHSSRRSGLARRVLADGWAALDAVGAIDPADAQRLIALGVRADRVVVTGDTRHDSAAARVAAIDGRHPALQAVRQAGATPMLVAGSTWPPDEAVLLPAIARVRARHPLGAVIAPHEPDERHLADLEHRIAATLPGARVVRLGALELETAAGPVGSSLPPYRLTALPPWDVCLVDRVGVLAELYAAAQVAFVGGGFHDGGLHSVIEPAAAGVPVLFGPRWRNSRDARLLLEAGAAVSASDEGALAAALERLVGNEAARREAASAARAVVERGLGAADRSLQIVIGLVEKRRRAGC